MHPKREEFELKTPKFALVICFLLVAVASFAQGDTPETYLVRVDIEKYEDIGSLLENGINVVQNLGSFVLARVGLSEIGLLHSFGFSTDVLDSYWGYSNHYVVSTRRGAEPSKFGEVVYCDENIAVIRKGIFLPFEPRPFDMKRLRDSPIRLNKGRKRNHSLMSNPMPDPLIQGMVDSVSMDTVESYLRSLQGVGTRYSLAPGCSVAAEYIRSNMEAAGLTAVLKPYGMSAMVMGVCCVDDSVSWAVDEAGGIYKSEDGGQTWQEKYKRQGRILGIFFLDSLKGWAVGDGDPLRTTDGGDDWVTLPSTGALGFFRCVFLDSLRGWASGASPDTTPAVYRTTDGGNSWTYSGPSFLGEFIDISFVDTLKGWVTGFDYDTNRGVVYATTDGGVGWAEQYETPGIALYGLNFVNSLKGWVSGYYLSNISAVMRVTTDGGQTWNPQTVSGWALGDVDFVDSLNGWCVGWSTLLRTVDGGVNWSSQFPPVDIFSLSIDMLDTLHGIYGGTDGYVLHTSNSGNNWGVSQTGGRFNWYNVEGVLPGCDIPDEIYIICAHHDDTSEDPMFNAPGADDNGSGTAGVLEAARVLSNYEFHRTIKFVTFSGEEQGLLGSEAYASEAESLGHNIMGVLNLDMIGYLDDSLHDLNVYCDMPSQWMADTILQFSAAYVPGLIPHKVVNPGMRGSDHASFWDEGYSALLHIERDESHWNPYYHSTGDTVGTLDLPYVTEMVQLGLASMAELASPCIVGVDERDIVRKGSKRLALTIAGNPFSDNVAFRVVKPLHLSASLKIYDSAGRLLKEFDPIQSEQETMTWDGSTDKGDEVSSGVYFVMLQAGLQTVSEKVVFVR